MTQVDEATTTALATVPVEERGLRGLELAEGMYDAPQRRQIAAMLSIPAESPALMPYLALCIAEGFSPWANHVWLIPKKVKMQSADGEGTTEVEKHLPAVGRDGLLHKARMTLRSREVGSFRGLRANVVCERDSFEVEDDGVDVRVLHRFASKPTEFAAEDSPDRYRGRVIGAWAKLTQEGLPPTFYYANLREHGRLRHVWAWNDAARKRKPLYHAPGGGVTFDEFTAAAGRTDRNRPVQEWEGAWDYVSTMILKAAQSYVLRIGMGVTGFVPVDELRDVREWQQDTGAAQAPPPITVEFDFDSLDVAGDVRERLRRAVEAANVQDPLTWGPAKCEMVFKSRSEDELLARIEDIERENDLREQRLAGAGAEHVVDATAVEEKGDAAPDAAPSASNEERVAVLMARLASLRAQAHSADEEQVQMVADELDQIIAELRTLGVDPDGAPPQA